MPTYDFTGKTAFVTGGSAGMGAATVRAFAEETAEAFDTIVAVNLRGVWASMKYEPGRSPALRCPSMRATPRSRTRGASARLDGQSAGSMVTGREVFQPCRSERSPSICPIRTIPVKWPTSL